METVNYQHIYKQEAERLRKGRRMKKIIGITSCAAALVLLSGCMAPSGVPGCGGPFGRGFIFQETTTPISSLAVATNPNVKPLKKGTATIKVTLGMIAEGDASINKAMENGGITKIHHVDYYNKSVLGLFLSEQTLIVYGE